MHKSSPYFARLGARGKYIFLLISMALLLHACGGQVRSMVSPAAPQAADLVNVGTIQANVTYCTVDGVELKMDMYTPEQRGAPTPVAVYVHGGGWQMGDKDRGQGAPDIRELVRRGYLVVAVNYRLAPEYTFPAQIEDIKCAIRSLRAHSTTYNLDPNRIGVWGGSAGGHLVALLGTSDSSAGWDVGEYLDQSSRVQAVVDMFGPADLTAVDDLSKKRGAMAIQKRLIKNTFGVEEPGAEILKTASPVMYVSADDPPFFILHGENDNIVPISQSERLFDQLEAVGVPAKFQVVKHAGHGFEQINASAPIEPDRKQITNMIADFFDQHLR